VFGLGVAMILLGLAMIAGGILGPPVAALGLVGGGLGVGLSGLLTAYLNAPERRRATAPGMTRAKATILDATVIPVSVAGFQMVELTLELQPKDGLPIQVKRKFSAGRIGRIERGRRLDVAYDPADPRRLELV
jgi:hypothetical protein